jgi:hypothetical protein
MPQITAIRQRINTLGPVSYNPTAMSENPSLSAARDGFLPSHATSE